MDELEDSVTAHSKYHRTSADWIKKMVTLLIEAKPFPVYYSDRIKLYTENDIPAYVFQQYDRRAFSQALHEFDRSQVKS